MSPRYPMNIDTSSWGPFDTESLTDQMCETERRAFTEYTLKRLKKRVQTGSDDSAIMIGGFMAIVQISYATFGNSPPDSARDALHQMIDFAWLQCATMAHDLEELN
jgi:hypothetical protein